MRIGIFGGSFNPPHMGHLNSLQTVLKKAGLDRIHVIPTTQNPLKVPTEGPSPQQRLEMTQAATQAWGKQFLVDDIEVRRGGKSYTIDTVKEFRKTNKPENLFLIIGMDKFEELAQWKSIEELLAETNFIVTSRPGYHFPDSEAELPEFIKKQVAEFDFNFIELNTGRSVQFLKLDDVEISGTELRKWLRIGKSVEKYIPLAVESYIKEHNLYRHLGHQIGDYGQFTQFCSALLSDKKAINVKAFDLRSITAPSEYTLIASGTSSRHASSLAENLIKAVKEEYNIHPQSVEGIDEGRWVVVDYGSLIVHLFYDFIRQEYSLESLWQKGTEIKLSPGVVKKD